VALSQQFQVDSMEQRVRRKLQYVVVTMVKQVENSLLCQGVIKALPMDLPHLYQAAMLVWQVDIMLRFRVAGLGQQAECIQQ
jgi:hypothetical protein